jgi:mediator of RNA polymerase II transcription subunit 16
MDDDMDIDDLFGEGATLSLPSRAPPSKELTQRIDELRRSGCCQYVSSQFTCTTLTDTCRTIAWSKWGSIASITPDGAVLEFRNLRCHPENGEWALSEPTKTPPLTSNLDGGPLKHICWSPTGSELAVIDAAGRVTILSIFSSLNKPTLSRHCQGDPADDLHGVVGCYWLNLAPYPANRPVR